jgi:hypothetical protein
VLIELGADNAYKEDWTKIHFVLGAFETFEFIFFVHFNVCYSWIYKCVIRVLAEKGSRYS